MEQAKEIKTRIKTVKNIAKVTKTMQMISANRMKKAVKRAADGLPYSVTLSEIVSKMGKIKEFDNIFTTQPSVVKNIAVIVIGPSKGFVGNLPSSLLMELVKNLEVLRHDYPKANFVGISLFKHGLKIAKSAGLKDDFHFANLSDNITSSSLAPIYTLIKDKFVSRQFDLVYLSYIDYHGTYAKDPKFIQILPIRFDQISKEASNQDSVIPSAVAFEPNSEDVLKFLLVEYFEKQILNAVMTSTAAEHSARMISMKSATDNALALMDKLTLNYNKGRQAQITEQIIEVATH